MPGTTASRTPNSSSGCSRPRWPSGRERTSRASWPVWPARSSSNQTQLGIAADDSPPARERTEEREPRSDSASGWGISPAWLAGRNVHELELDPVGVEEEDGVVAGDVVVLARVGFDRRARREQPAVALVDDVARGGVEREVVEPDAVAVRPDPVALRLAEADRAARAAEIPDRLAALPLHFADPRVAERAEQLTVEGQAALDRRDDQVDVVDAGRGHALLLQRRPTSSSPRP